MLELQSQKGDGRLKTGDRMQTLKISEEGDGRQETEDGRLRTGAAQTFEDLIVWQKAHQFVLSIYKLTETFPSKEMYGLTSQFRRAAISIPSNIAEGFRKRSKADKARFMNIAQGSVEECRYYLILTRDLGYGQTEDHMNRLVQVSKLLHGYSSALLSPVSSLPSPSLLQ